MARKRTSIFEDLIEIASRLPWWASLILAATAFLIIHPFAVMDVAVPPGTRGIGQGASAQLVKTLALIGQYLVPAAFLLGAVVSVFRRRKREKIYRSVAEQVGKRAPQGLDWRAFELLIGQWFRTQRYAVTETGGVGDGGVDLVLTRDGETFLVQCKHWKAFKVGVNIVRELLGVMIMRGASGGFIVTSGVFTEEARRFAADCHITLIDGTRLSEILREGRTTQPAPPPDASATTTPPTCPKCGSAMVLRKVKQGTRTGQALWGCSRFPTCRGTRPVL